MRYAISIPNFGAFADAPRLAELAKEAEDKGWDGFFLWDHIHWTQQPMLDPWMALTVIASSTSRIRMGTMITPVARRRPWKLARETVTLDHLSGGRLILGVGLGGGSVDEEFTRLGEDPDDRVRARRLDEGLEVLTGLWSGKPFSFRGDVYQIDNATFLPRPVQEPRIPIWVAGVWPNRAPFRRAARWDGVVPLKTGGSPDQMPLLQTPEDLEKTLAYVRRHRDVQGSFDVSVSAAIPQDEGAAREVVNAYEAAGATWLMEWQPDPDALSARLRRGVPK